MLPVTLVGASSVLTRLRNRASREGFSARASRLLERLSGTITMRWVGSAPAVCGVSANKRLTVWATSTAEACFSGMTMPSLPLGWSIDSMIFSMRCRLLA